MDALSALQPGRVRDLLPVGAFVLWTFGRLDHTGLGPILVVLIVPGFPASLDAAAARLIL